MTRSSPVVEMLLDMRFDSGGVSNNIVVESYIVKFDRIFVSVKDTIYHGSGVGL